MTKVIGEWYKANPPEEIPRWMGARPWMIDRPLLLTAICKANAVADSDETYITDDAHLARVGGIEQGDIAYVQPYNVEQHRPCFVEEQVDAHLLTPTDPPTNLVEPDGQPKVGAAWVGGMYETVNATGGPA